MQYESCPELLIKALGRGNVWRLLTRVAEDPQNLKHVPNRINRGLVQADCRNVSPNVSVILLNPVTKKKVAISLSS